MRVHVKEDVDAEALKTPRGEFAHSCGGFTTDDEPKAPAWKEFIGMGALQMQCSASHFVARLLEHAHCCIMFGESTCFTALGFCSFGILFKVWAKSKGAIPVQQSTRRAGNFHDMLCDAVHLRWGWAAP